MEVRKNNVVIDIGGRLGNNLFQIATAYQYAMKTNRNLLVDCHTFPWISYWQTYKWLHKFSQYEGDFSNFIEYHEDNKFNFREIPEYKGKDVHLFGSWETEDFFPDRELINNLYKCSEDIENKIRDKYPDIDGYVGISIRRGDYLNFRNTYKIPKITWYEKCYNKYFNGRKALIFSDDIEWCKKNLNPNVNFEFYEKKTSGDRYMIEEPEVNLYTMGLCHDHICSDSTWSWWGARICEQEGAINVFQDKRFTIECGEHDENYIPQRWIKEETEYE